MSSSHVVAAVPCRVPTNPATLAPGAVHITDSPMTLGPVGASLNLAAPGLSLSPSLRAACVCPPACVDLLRALDIITRPLGSRPARPPPQHRVPDAAVGTCRPHKGAKRRATTNADVLLSAVVGKLRLDRLTPDHHTRPAPAAIGCCPLSSRACATSRRHATPRHSTSPFTGTPTPPMLPCCSRRRLRPSAVARGNQEACWMRTISCIQLALEQQPSRRCI